MLAVAALLVGLSSSPVGAEPEDVSAPVVGSLTINGGQAVFEEGAVFFVGTFDPETGELLGEFDFPDGETVTELATVQRSVAVSGGGSVDLDTNEVTYDGTLVLTLNTISILGGAPEPLNECRYVGELSLTGVYDPDANVVDIPETAFSLVVDPTAPADRCHANAAITGALDEGVLGENGEGEDNALEASFDLGFTEPSPAEQVEQTEEEDPPVAPPADPVAAQPTFAG